MTVRTAHEIAADVSATLRREFPELLVRDGAADGDLDAGLLTLVRWLLDRIGTDDRLARVGGTRICDQLLLEGFPRRPLIRGVALIRAELGHSDAPDHLAAARVTTGLLEVLSRRLVPDAPAAPSLVGLAAVR